MFLLRQKLEVVEIERKQIVSSFDLQVKTFFLLFLQEARIMLEVLAVLEVVEVLELVVVWVLVVGQVVGFHIQPVEEMVEVQ